MATTQQAGQFSVSKGQILDPNGQPFTAHGINMFLDQADAATILKTLPGINMVRLAVTPSSNRTSIDTLVQGLTSKGVVVEIEDHTSSGATPAQHYNNVVTGAALQTQLAFETSLASEFKANSNVWFGTPNEPDDIADISAVPKQERAVYDAIRATGNTNPILLEERGGSNPDANQQSAALFSDMENVVWATHFYNGGATSSTDQATIDANLAKQIAGAAAVKTANGTAPVIVEEYGPSITGSLPYDTNWRQTLTAVQTSGSGSLAWAWNAGADALVDGKGLTDFGQEVAGYFASASTPMSPPMSPAGGSPTLPSAPAAGMDHLTLMVSEDTYKGDAQFTVAVDGKQVGGTLSATVSHAAGKDSTVTLEGAWGPGAHTIQISFINDAWGGSATTDRNLYVDGIKYDGVSVAGAPTMFGVNSTQSFKAEAGSGSTASHAAMTVHLSEDTYKGDAQFTIQVDGKAVSSGTATASHAAGKTQDVVIENLSLGAHDVAVTFVNDAWDGTAATDRNLYVNSIDFNGHSTPGAALYSAGTQHFQAG